MSDDTIYALASGGGRAGVSVIRLSGPQAGEVLKTLCRRDDLPTPRKAVRVFLRDPKDDFPIDDGLVLWFPGPASFTGEDVVEFHCHGSPAVMTAMYAVLGSMSSVRLADPGEFTRRAFDHGKMDLTEAEGLGDLINAQTEAQRRQAFRQMQGSIGKLYHGWADSLVKCLAHYEAVIDFPDEDLPPKVEAELRGVIARVKQEILDHLQDGHRGEMIRSGLAVAIIGAPNAGKSSLLNQLARRDVAIVSDRAGTTRDVIEIHLDLKGYPVVIADTAGLREDAGEIEAEGIRRARDRAEKADFKIALFDGTQLDPDDATTGLVDNDTLVVFNKSDEEGFTSPTEFAGREVFSLSARTGSGLEDILDRLGEEVEQRCFTGNDPVITRERHRQSLQKCHEALVRFEDAPLAELAGEDLRLAIREIGHITGRIDVEDLLDMIFRDFCIGK